MAQIHMDEKRWADARKEIERELAIVPESAGARALLARLKPSKRERRETGLGIGVLVLQVLPSPSRRRRCRGTRRLLETLDGELPFAGIVDERSAGITQALRTRDYERAETLLLQAAEARIPHRRRCCARSAASSS